MTPLEAHLLGYLSLFLQIGVVALLAVLAALVRFSLGRRGIDAWVFGLGLYTAGLVIVGFSSLDIHSQLDLQVKPTWILVYAMLEDAAAIAFLVALRSERGREGVQWWMIAAVVVDVFVTAWSVQNQGKFLDEYRVHSACFGALFLAGTIAAVRLRNGAGRNVLIGAFALLAFDYLHTPLLGLLGIELPSTYIGLESYVTVAFDIILGVGIVVHATDGVRRELEQRNKELAAADQALRLAAYGDALCGVPNRTAFLERLADPPVRGSVAMADLDDLKGLNDRYGHAAGDAALIAVARVLTQRVGSCGSVYRIGGDEFAVIWSRLDADDARALLRAADADLTVVGEDLAAPQRISWGVAAFDAGAPLRDALMEADHALYTEKAARRR